MKLRRRLRAAGGPLQWSIVFCLLACAAASTVRADGEVVVRGNYWRDRNTRVLAPQATVRQEAPTGTTVEVDYLLDAITSASAAAGGLSDQPFTEIRNDIGARLAQRLGPTSLSVLYRYSTESDYWSHTAGGAFSVDLFQKNLTLATSYVYGHNTVAMRRGALGFIPACRNHLLGDGTYDCTLDTHYWSLSAAVVLSPRSLLEICYELSALKGFQSNPYRPAMVSGNGIVEVEPDARLRNTLTGVLRYTPVYKHGAIHHLTLLVKYRFYIDDWGMRGHTPELRVALGLGPTELRLTGRYHAQGGVDFLPKGYDASSTGALPTYDMGVARANCPPAGCYTGDAKLTASSSYFLELRFQLGLQFLNRPKVPLGRWIGQGVLAVSAGHYWNNNAPQTQFGDAWVGGAELSLPL